MSSSTHSSRPSNNIGPAMVGVQWMFIALAIITVTCRIYIRCIRKSTAGLDDILIVIAMLLSIFGGICANIFEHNGIGRHVWHLSQDQIEEATKWLITAVLESYISLFFVRMSIGVLILRMLAKVQFKLRLAVCGVLFLNFAVTLMIACVVAMWCRPMEGIWNKRIHGTCLSAELINNANRAFAGISAATDVLYACLPVAVVWRLQMDFSTKRNLVIVMLFTIVICICAIGKATSVNETDPDFTYANVPSEYWAVAEDNLGIIVACLPSLRQFYVVTRDDIASLRSKASSQRALVCRNRDDDTAALRHYPTSGSARPWQTPNDSEADRIGLPHNVAQAK